MIRARERRFLALAFGLWLALSPALLAVPVAAFAMPASSSMAGGPASADCDGCPDTDLQPDGCALLCLHALLFGTLTDFVALPESFGGGDPRRARASARGRVFAPDPAPPRHPFFP